MAELVHAEREDTPRRGSGHGLVVRNLGGAWGWRARRLVPSCAKWYFAWQRWRKSGAIRRFVADSQAATEPPRFKRVEIETINRCNGSCSFCPVNRHVDPRPPRRMDEKLFERLLEQLSEMEYAGYLALYSNNEPLLDTRLADFAREARRRVPKAYIHLATNGLLLTVETLRALMPSLDRILVDNYRDVPEMHPGVKEVHDYALTPEGQGLLAGKTLEISLRHGGDVLTNRAGQSPNSGPRRKPLPLPCVLPFMQLVIRPEGGVSLCCCDAYGAMTLGDASSEPLAAIWGGPRFSGVRSALAAKGRAGIPLCAACDSVYAKFP